MWPLKVGRVATLLSSNHSFPSSGRRPDYFDGAQILIDRSRGEVSDHYSVFVGRHHLGDGAPRAFSACTQETATPSRLPLAMPLTTGLSIAA